MSRILPVVYLLALCFSSPAFSAEAPGRDEYFYARKLFEEKYYDLAADQLERCLRDFPALSEADEAQFLLGEAYLRSGDPDRARAAFLRTTIVYPESPRAPEALFKVGESLEKAGRLREAAQALERVQGFYSGSILAPGALGRSANLYAQSGDSLKSDEITARLIEKYPDSPYSSIARLDLAERLIAKNDYRSAIQFLNWVATRAGLDSLSGEAWIRLGKLHTRRFDLTTAIESFQTCIDRYPTTVAAAEARVSLADIHNLRGSYDSAIRIVAPLLASSSPKWRIEALNVSGDAEYLRGNFESALNLFDSASTGSHEAMLKAAWCAELTGKKKTAQERYSRLANAPGTLGVSAKIRAALLASEFGQSEKAANLWVRVINDPVYVDSSGRGFYELARARSEAKLEDVQAAADSLLIHYPLSPYTDDVQFVSAKSYLRKGDYASAVKHFETLARNYPASPFIDSAYANIQYIYNFHIRGERLIERMAELSSLPQNRTNPVRWALDWGDFYLDEFKDPVKAADQYDRVLDDILATTEDRLYALYKSGIAYQLLAESAKRERDSFSLTMYSDSAHNRLNRLQSLSSLGSLTLRFATRMLEFDAVNQKNTYGAPANLIRRYEDLVSRFGEDSLSVSSTYFYLTSMSSQDKIDSKNFVSFIGIAERAARRTSDRTLIARLKLWEVTTLAKLEESEAAHDTTLGILARYSGTSPAADLLLGMVKSDRVSPAKKLDYLQEYRRLYPYLVDNEELNLLEANLLDLENRPLEALAKRERADIAAGWGRPDLELLNYPAPVIRLERASAYRRAGLYTRGAEELAIILNTSPGGELGASAIYEYALLERDRNNALGAIVMVDSLIETYSNSEVAGKARLLRPSLLMEVGRYGEAGFAYQALSKESTNPDSIFQFRVNEIICQLRQQKFEESKKSSAELLKQYKEKSDIDNYKALFIFEKGMALEKSGKGIEARENFALVRDKHSLSPYADKAFYYFALSLLDEEKLDEGAKVMEQFISNYPESPLVIEAWLKLGVTQYKLERYSESLVTLSKVWEAKNGQKYWQASFEALATAYRSMRFFDAAIRLNREYLARFPDAPDALDRRMDIAQFYIEIKEWDEAIRQYRPLLPFADAEREAEIQYYLGEANLGKGDFRSAILEFLKVKVLGRKTKLDWGVTAIYQAGFCYEKLGDYEGASRMYRKIVEETGETSNYGRAAKQKLESLPTAQVPNQPSGN